MKKRFITLLLSVLLLSNGSRVLAAETPPPSDSVGTYALNDFVRDCRVYTPIGTEVEVTTDPNWDINEDTLVTVSLKDAEGPTSFVVTIWHKPDSGDNWYFGEIATLSFGQTTSFSCSIPEDDSLRVTAAAVAGVSGYATFQVSLS